MRNFNKTIKFNKRDSSSPKKRDFRGPKREFDGPSGGSNKFEKRGNRSGGSRDSGFELHEVTCDKCGRKCDVPFKPTNNKPVYCRTCFRQNDSTDSKGGFERFDQKGRGNDRFDSRDRFNDGNDKFESKNSSGVSSEDLEKINRKLDKIMRALKID
jgi:CxxC-x17-CxxC domain-containing protein